MSGGVRASRVGFGLRVVCTRIGILVAGVVLAGLLTGSAGAVAPAFEMVDLGTLGGTFSYARGVNDAGQVVGRSATAGNAASHAFSWTEGGGMIDLGKLGGDDSEAVAVSDSGQVVGRSSTAVNGSTHAFSWTAAGGMVDLGTLGGNSSEAVAVNGAGLVVGWSYTAGDRDRHAFSWTAAGGMVDLGTLGGPSSQPSGVNDAGLVVGNSSTAAGAPTHAFSWTTAGGIVDLVAPGVSYSYASGVNEAGQVVGQFGATGSSSSHPYLWSKTGGMVDLGTLGGDFGSATRVNETGQVVGFASIAGTRPCVVSPGLCPLATHAFSWTKAGGMVDLGTLGGRDSFATGVNDSGQVVGWDFWDDGNGCPDLDGECPLRAFSWTKAGGIVDLGPLVGVTPDGVWLNNAGQIVGSVSVAGNAHHAVLWQPTKPADKAAPVASPTRSPAANGAGWNSTNVTVTWNWADGAGGSGIDASHCTTSSTSTGEGNPIKLSATCRDLAGNVGNASYEVKVDVAKPTLSPSVSPSVLYLNASGAKAAAGAADALSGVSSSSCGAVETRTAGSRAVTCTATDKAGNTSSQTIAYVVQYRIRFGSPPPGSKWRKGQTVPVTFGLRDANGVRISDAQAAGLVASCKVRFSATGAQIVTPKCVRYDSRNHWFSVGWRVGRTTGRATITVTVSYPGTATTTSRSETIIVVAKKRKAGR